MANRYWVGGTGNWSDIAHWSATTGGAGGASVPTSVDNALFDALSFSATGQTVTVDVVINCADMNWTGALYNPTLDGGQANNIFGSLILISAMTITQTGPITFSATTMGKTITTAGLTILSTVTFDGVGGGWTLQDALILSSNRNLVLNKGTLDTNGKSVTCNNFNTSNSNIRTLTLGSSTLTVGGSWFLPTVTNLTFNPGTSTIVMSGTTSPGFSSGGLTYNNVTLSGSPYVGINQDTTFNTLTFAASTTIRASGTQTITNLVANGAAGNITIQSQTTGTPYTFRVLTGTITFNYCSIQDCTATGGATFNAINSTNVSGNTGITFSGSGYGHKIFGLSISKIYGISPSKINGI